MGAIVSGAFAGAVSGWILLSTVAAVVGVGLIASELLLARTVRLGGPLGRRRLEQALESVGEHARDERRDELGREHRVAVEAVTDGFGRAGLLPADTDLQLLAVSRDAAALQVSGAMGVGFALPLILIGTWTARTMGGGASTALPVALTLVLAPLGGLLGAVIVRRQLIASASAMRTDLRHQLSAYLDLVTMLVSGQSGHESALEQATGFGDGRLFTELRSSFRRSVAAGGSMVDGLRSVGERFDIVELDQVAASIELADSDGAPIARSLGAKCATLRSTLASEHELEARLRTSRLTAPIVGMSLVFMVLVIYPAMAVT
jgi:Flp pilus assembly protein TadB